MKKVLLAICDTPTVNTGFGTVSNNILSNIKHEFDIHILGINYYGDPHTRNEFKIYNPSIGGDVYGFGRLQEMLARVQPDVIFLINDPWVVAQFVIQIRRITKDIPIVVYTPVDSPAIKPEFILPLNETNHVISYTQWGLEELRKSGLTVAASVAPHGINTSIFNPVSKTAARNELFKGLDKLQKDPFVVLYTARNQPRKRVDLFVYIFAEWMKKYPHENAYMHYHGAAKGDLGWDIDYLAWYYKVDNRLILTSRHLDPSAGLPLDKMRVLYSGADVYLQVCAVEGWGLPLMEAMACKVPAIVPDFSALSEWPYGAVHYVNVDPTPWHNINNIDTLHKTISVPNAVEALERLYQDTEYRKELAEKGYAHVTQGKYMWTTIAKHFAKIFKDVTMSKDEQWKLTAASKLQLLK